MAGKHGHVLYYQMPVQKVIERLNSSSTGLCSKESIKRIRDFGQNKVSFPRSASWRRVYLRQFDGWLTILLLASAALSWYTGEWQAAIALLTILVINSVVQFWQDYRPPSFPELRHRLAHASANVLRDGVLVTKSSQNLVLGDVVFFAAGDPIPADIRLVKVKNVCIDEAELTGTAYPAHKFVHTISNDALLERQQNLAFMGTSVITGEGWGVVIATGNATEIGKIIGTHQLSKRDETAKTAHEKFVIRSLLLTVLLAAGLPLLASFSGLAAHMVLFFVVAIAVSLTPMWLPLETLASHLSITAKLKRLGIRTKNVSVASAIGKCNTLVVNRDKLPKEISVNNFFIGRDSYEVTGRSYQPVGRVKHENRWLHKTELENMAFFFRAAVFTANANLLPPDDDYDKWRCLGSPEDGALLSLAMKAGLAVEHIREATSELAHFAATRGSNGTSSVRAFGNGEQVYVFVKDSPEQILENCQEIWDHGHIRPMSEKDKEFLRQTARQVTKDGNQMTALAYRQLPQATNLQKLDSSTAQQNLTWLGMLSFSNSQSVALPNNFEIFDAPHKQFSYGHTAAVGNCLRDLPLFEQASVSFAFQSSPIPVKQSADFIIKKDDLHIISNAKTLCRTILDRQENLFVSHLFSSSALLLVVVASLVAGVFDAAPPALSLLQLVALAFLVQLLPLRALFSSRPNVKLANQGKNLGSVLTAGLACLNYVWFFARNNINLAGLSSSSVIHERATTLVFLTISLCLLTALIEQTNLKRLIGRCRKHYTFWLSILGSLCILGVIIYVPGINSFFKSARLSTIDVLYALAAAVIFSTIRAFQCYERKHHRHEILALHRATTQKTAS
jgi:magnesium-transporting ATPase (P-type)